MIKTHATIVVLLVMLALGALLVFLIVHDGVMAWNRSATVRVVANQVDKVFTELDAYSHNVGTHVDLVVIRSLGDVLPVEKLTVWQNLNSDAADIITFGCNWTRKTLLGANVLWMNMYFNDAIIKRQYTGEIRQRLSLGSAHCVAASLLGSYPAFMDEKLKELINGQVGITALVELR